MPENNKPLITDEHMILFLILAIALFLSTLVAWVVFGTGWELVRVAFVGVVGAALGYLVTALFRRP